MQLREEETTFSVLLSAGLRARRRVHKFDTPAIVAALKARRPELYKDGANVALQARVEVGARVQVGGARGDDRSASLSDVARVLVEAGALEAAQKVVGWAQER